MHPTETGKIFIAEKAAFGSLTDFLRMEFYRGLAAGNAPRRCHNCGRYFLLTAGYNTCYCNNIALGEIERTLPQSRCPPKGGPGLRQPHPGPEGV